MEKYYNALNLVGVKKIKAIKELGDYKDSKLQLEKSNVNYKKNINDEKKKLFFFFVKVIIIFALFIIDIIFTFVYKGSENRFHQYFLLPFLSYIIDLLIYLVFKNIYISKKYKISLKLIIVYLITWGIIKSLLITLNYDSAFNGGEIFVFLQNITPFVLYMFIVIKKMISK